MAVVVRLALRVLHFLYSLFLAIWSIRSRYFRPAPRSLAATRSKTPSHLALVLASQEPDLCVPEAREVFLKCTENAILWCRAADIQRLSVYDRLGILLEAFDVIGERLENYLPPTQVHPSLAEAVFPLTPPLSDDSDVPDECHYKGKSCIKTIRAGDVADKRRKWSRGRAGILRHRTHGPSSSEPFTLHLVSRDTGKPTIAALADSFLRRARDGLHRNSVPMDKNAEVFQISVPDLQAMLEGDGGYGPPDLMIVHNVTVPRRQSIPLELYSFPPWQVRLTEIHHNGFSRFRDRWMRTKLRGRAKTWIMLSELDFRRALDEYSSAEFRLGK
ncbi:hypothetical protein BC826DRAFT_977768 [Russula brevipes]|nr:hypothetical protein BC826DRAFT_977768 [Russula brevipes]